jgi:hypothetical protein
MEDLKQEIKNFKVRVEACRHIRGMNNLWESPPAVRLTDGFFLFPDQFLISYSAIP